MKISVIVPAFNEEKLIERSLSAIRAAGVGFERLGWQWEMIVCNNNSTDRTAELAEAAGAKVVFEPVNQISRARNCGASVATGDWLIFIDADSFPSAELFDDVATVIQSGMCIGGGSTVKLDDLEGFIRGIAWSWNWLSRWKRWMAGSFVFCPAKVFRQLGGFSEQLFAAEELDFSKRLKTVARDRGLKVVIL
ncbi:MAG TPA: glycosyltransferase, partial [Candidatus Nitrosotalea sp.]|nr:glycosyltransferase [Candidatus Nitrosotalea sp.]